MPRAGDAIFLCALSLLCIGVVMVNSAGLSVDGQSAVTLQTILFSRSSAYMAVAVIVMLAASRLPLAKLGARRKAAGNGTGCVPTAPTWVPLLLPLMLVLLALVYVPGIGREVNGARRWVGIPGSGFSMQPSEIAKWGMILVLAWYGATRVAVMRDFQRGLLPALAALVAVAGLITLEDLGTGVLVAASGSLLLIAAGARVVHFLMFAPLLLLGFAAAIITSPYRMTRLITFWDPYSDPDGTGYHMIQSLVAVANGGGWGRGLGFGLQKFGYLPEDRNDFLFAVICEELGLAGAALVIALYLALLACGWAITRRQTSPFLRLTSLGIIVTLTLQALINLFVVTGLAPTKGIALPLLSAGGTGWILTAGSLGLLIAMDRLADARGPALEGTGSPASAPLPRAAMLGAGAAA